MTFQQRVHGKDPTAGAGKKEGPGGWHRSDRGVGRCATREQPQALRTKWSKLREPLYGAMFLLGSLGRLRKPPLQNENQ